MGMGFAGFVRWVPPASHDYFNHRATGRGFGVKCWVLVCLWRFDWSFARLIAPVVTAHHSPPPSSSKSRMETFWYRLTQVHVKTIAIKRTERERERERYAEKMLIHFTTFNADRRLHHSGDISTFFWKSCQRIPFQCNFSGSWLTRNIDDTICHLQTQYL